ncbi:ABC transporter substrate-binding protein [Amycolatopsis sp. H6(2020)]|nr:ABC transporter substrate-binding protein [Amycolatopsis sp. H6(2020)]
MVAALVAGCGAGATADADTLRFAVQTGPSELDPHASQSDVTALLTRPVLDSLVSVDASGTVRPWLATSWETGGDHRSYTFTLREGVRFTDGTPFDAAAVQANLDHIVAPATKSQLATGLIAPYAGTQVIDARTVRVGFSRPFTAFLTALSTPYLGMQSPAALRQGPDAQARKIVGTGPFEMETYVPGQGVVYHRNPGYGWPPQGAPASGPPKLKRIEVRILPEDSVRVGALTSGQVDAAGGIPPINVAQLARDSRIRIENRQVTGGVYSYYPNTASGPFADVRVRRAFRAGIDWHTFVGKLYRGVYRPASSPISPSSAGYDPSTQGFDRYDPGTAAGLLDQAGWTGRDAEGFRTRNGERLTIRWMFVRNIAREQRSVLAEQVQAAARKAGFDVRFLDLTLATYARTAISGDYDLADFSWSRVDADALRDLFHSANVSSETGGSNAARYADPQVDRLLDRALAIDDPAGRAPLYAEVQRKVLADAAVFPVYAPEYVIGTRKNVHGISWEQQGYPGFYGAWMSA